MADLATAYVQIIPTTKGIGKSLESDLGGAADSAGKSSGGKFADGFSKAGKAGLVAFGAMAAAGGVATKMLVDGTKSVAAYGDNIDKMSQKMGLSAEAYQEWDAIMQHSGTSIDSMQRGMTTLSKAAESGSDAFAKLGISQEELANLSQEDLFARTIEGLQGMESGSERTVLAQQLLGGSARELGALLNTSAEDTEKMRQKVHELGGVMNDEAVKAAANFQDNMQDLQTAISGVGRSITSEFLPASSELMEGFAGILTGEEGAEEKLASGMDNMAVAAGNSIDKISGIMGQLMPAISSAITKLLPKIIELGGELVLSLAEGIVDNLPELVNAILDISTTLTAQAPEMFEKVVQALLEVLKSIGDRMPELVPVMVDMILGIVDALIDNADLMVEAALAIVVGLAEGIIESLPTIIAKIPELIEGIIQALVAAIPMLIEAGIQLFVALVENLPAIIEGIVAAIPEIIAAILEGLASLSPALGALFQGAWEFIVGVWNVAVGFFQGIWDGISAVFSVVGEVLSGFFQGAWDLIQGIWSVVVSFFSGVWSGIVSVFSGVASFFSGVFQAAWNAITSIFNKLGSFFSGVWNAVVSIFRDAGVAVGDAISGAVRGAVNAILGGATSIINGFISAINFAIAVINAIPGVSISPIGYLSAPALARGGILEKGEVGLLEGTGAEAVVPLDQNRAWIHAVTMDFMSELQNQYALGRSIAGSSVGGSAYSEGVDNTWNNGDIIIPVSIGGRQIERIVVEADRINALRTGGR